MFQNLWSNSLYIEWADNYCESPNNVSRNLTHYNILRTSVYGDISIWHENLERNWTASNIECAIGHIGKIETISSGIRHLTMKSCAKWQNFLRKKNTYANAGISTRFLTVSPAAMISLP